MHYKDAVPLGEDPRRLYSLSTWEECPYYSEQERLVLKFLEAILNQIWLPEPIATDDSPDTDLYMKDILSYSLLVLLEKLNAKERAVFILKETFDYLHPEISEILSITEEHSRKLLSRAKTRLSASEIFFAEQKLNKKSLEQVQEFIEAIRKRDYKYLQDYEVKTTLINHQPALIFYHDSKVTTCQILKIDQSGKIEQIYSVIDPEKLRSMR